MESGSKIVSANVSSEPFCEHVASSFLNALLGSCSIAAGSSQNSLPGDSSLICLLEEDVPSTSQNGREPCRLHLVELKGWLESSAAITVGKKQDRVKRWDVCTIVLKCSIFLILTSTPGFDAVFVITILLAWMLKLWTLMIVMGICLLSTVNLLWPKRCLFFLVSSVRGWEIVEKFGMIFW